MAVSGGEGAAVAVCRQWGACRLKWAATGKKLMTSANTLVNLHIQRQYVAPPTLVLKVPDATPLLASDMHTGSTWWACRVTKGWARCSMRICSGSVQAQPSR